jgi:hypothetical protein
MGESVAVESLQTGTHNKEAVVVPVIGSENTVLVVVLFDDRLLANESEADRVVRSVAQVHLTGDSTFLSAWNKSKLEVGICFD